MNFKQRFQRWCCGDCPHRDNHPLLYVELIEARRMLAGNVDVTVIGPDLVVSGDGFSNDIEIEQLIPGVIRVSSGPNATDINGGPGPSIFPGITRDLRIQMNKGGDSVRIANTNIPRDVNFQGDHGDNSVALVNSNVGRNVRISNLTGDDDVGLQDSTVTGNVQIANRKGGSYTALNNTDVGGNLTVTNRDGSDYLFVADHSMVSGNVRHTTGDGDSMTGVFDSEIGQRLLVNGNNDLDVLSMTVSVISGDLRFNGRGGQDYVDVFYTLFESDISLVTGGNADEIDIQYGVFRGDLTVRSRDALSTDLFGTLVEGKTDIVTGNGIDHFEIDDSTFEDTFRLISRGGGDNVDLEKNNVPPSTQVTEFEGEVLINLGADNDVIEIGVMSNPHHSAVFHAYVTLNGGSGNGDWLDHLTHGNTYAIPPSVAAFEFEV